MLSHLQNHRAPADKAPSPGARRRRPEAPGIAGNILALQQSIGNRATQRLLAAGHSPASPAAGPLVVQGEWDLDTYLKENPMGNVLQEMLPDGANANARSAARKRLKEWSSVTDSAQQVRELLRLVGRPALTDLLKHVSGSELKKLLGSQVTPDALNASLAKAQRAGGVDTYFAAVATSRGDALALIALEPDLDVLTRLAAVIPTPPGMKAILAATPQVAGGRGAFVEATIAQAGGWVNVGRLSTYKTDMAVLRRLLSVVPVPTLLAELADPERKKVVSGKGDEIADLLAYGDFAHVLGILGKGVAGDKAKIAVTTAKLDTNRSGVVMHPKAIYFTQATVTNQGTGYTVRGNITKLKSEPGWDIPGPVRLFKMTDEIAQRARPQRGQFGEASPANLYKGEIYTLDNRRLYAYQQAGRSAMPGGTFVPVGTVLAEAYKFTTTDGGETAALTS
jgi:hypothetical protein